MFVGGALDDVARVERINAIKFLETYDLERAAFCEQKAFPLKLPLQKDFKYLGLSLKLEGLNSIGSPTSGGSNSWGSALMDGNLRVL